MVQKSLKARIQQGATPDSGLTLIECLVAIAVIAITSAVIAPAMLLSVATRVQSQRAEQALQLAQSEIDQVRLIVERTTDYTEADLGIASVPGTGPTTEAATVQVPNAVPATTFNINNYQAAKAVDVDNDGENDFAVQAFRVLGQDDASGKPVAFEMGVRVYDYDTIARNEAEQVVPGDPDRNTVKAASLGQTSGEGERGTRPLAVLYSYVVKGDQIDSLCDYFRYQGSTPSTITALQCN
ncbi:MAG: prepilin-type N-terminal cleavage/methylation domain-containing protein [Cyanobacteria bacterium J06635_15]